LHSGYKFHEANFGPDPLEMNETMNFVYVLEYLYYNMKTKTINPRKLS